MPLSDVREVHNYVTALEYGLERLHTLPLSMRLIREIHACLMQGVRGEIQTPGEFRHSQNWIGTPGCTLNEATFVPPSVPEMHHALDDLETFLHDAPDLPPLVLLGLIHYQFEAIHPFLDGNGRIGRLLVSLLMCAWNLVPQPMLYLSAYFEAHRHSYYDLLLAVSRDGAWHAWLSFFLNGVFLQAQDATTRSRQLHGLWERYRTAFQEARAAARLLSVVDLAFSRPILTTKQVADSLGVTFAIAQRYVSRLESEGMLREVTGRTRNRIYQADEILAAI